MKMFDPNNNKELCEVYLSRFLHDRVENLQAEMLTKSTRDAPWRLDVEVNGAKKSYVLRLESRGFELEYRVLQAMESIPIPTPRVYGWDPQGEALGVPCFFSDFIEGESLLKPMVAGEKWAEELYSDTAYQLQGITEEHIGEITHQLERESSADILEDVYQYFQSNPHPLADRAYDHLKESMLALPGVCFSNGDLWLDNFIVREQKLAGVIDFANAGFSDPIYEFLLSFFVSPGLQGRGLEARYCQRLGFEADILDWYHGLEYFDTWRWVSMTGEPFVHHSDESLQLDLKNWLDEVRKAP